MKIAIYSPMWPPGDNGISTYAGHLVPSLRRLGHEVFVLTPSNNGPSDEYVIELGRYKKSPTFWTKILFRISPADALYQAASAALLDAVSDLVKRGVEILEIEESHGLGYAVSKAKSIPVCVRLHGPWFLTKRYSDRRRETLEGRSIAAADLVTSPSNWVLKQTKARYNISGPSSAFANPIELTQKIWAPENVEGILFVGRFDRLKGGDVAIEAFGKLASRNPTLSMTFVGPDLGIDGTGVREYAKSILSPSALSRFNYLGKLAPARIGELRLRHSVTICASRQENMPYSVMEAMVYGCPVVASSVGGIPELLREDCGILFESQNSIDLAASIQRLLDDTSLAQRLGHNAREASFFFQPDRIANETLAQYEKAITRFKVKEMKQVSSEVTSGSTRVER